MKKIKFILVAMIATLGLALSVPQVFANNVSNFKLSNEGDPETEEALSEFFLGKSGYISEYTLNRDEKVTLKSSGKLTFENRTLDVSKLYYDIEIMNVTFKAAYDGDPGTEEALSEFFLGKSGYISEYTLNRDEKVTLHSSGKLTFENRTLDVSKLYYDIEIIYDSLRPEDSVPAISGEHTVINNIDNPFTLERIREIAKLTANDAYYGDISDDIEVESETYTENKNKVGAFEINYKVANASGITTRFKLIVSNVDIVGPVINGPGTLSMSYTEEVVLSNLIAKYTVTDNHDTGIKLVLDSTNHVEGVPGVYQFKFSATDKSKNTTYKTLTLTLVDDQKPIITDANTGVIEVNWKDKVTDAVLKLGLTAYDEISGDLTEDIRVIENNLTSTLGSYTVKYEVTDDAGNKALYTRTYKVITTDAPIFWVSENLLLVSEVDMLSPEQLASELARYENIQMASFMFIENNYNENEHMPGDYQIKLAVADIFGEEHIIERTVQVFANSDLPQVEVTFWQKAINFFKTIWNGIVTVVKWIWNLIVKIVMFIPNLFKGKQNITYFKIR